MKQFLLFVLAFAVVFSAIVDGEEVADCKIKSNFYPKNILVPIIIYSAKKEDKTVNFTVLNKSHLNLYYVKKDLHFYRVTDTNESWYSDQKTFDEDMFNSCVILNKDIKSKNSLMKNQNQNMKEVSQDTPSGIAPKTPNSLRAHTKGANQEGKQASKLGPPEIISFLKR